ncbi:MAG: hypothetical protein ACKV2T_17000 [Kofleriaceae bacterium]
MKLAVVSIVALSGCLTVGGNTAVNVALNDSPLRRIGGAYEIGNLVEIVEDELAGQLFYAREKGPLRSRALGTWGGRLTSTQRSNLPGLFLQGSYGQNDEMQFPAQLVMIGAGVAYVRHYPAWRGRLWTAFHAGVVYHRQRQVSTNSNAVGHFVGFELALHVGFDLIGPMY